MVTNTYDDVMKKLTPKMKELHQITNMIHGYGMMLCFSLVVRCPLDKLWL